MAGLFGVESPEEVRARIGATGREQDLNLARLPAGRGAVALASKQGRLIGQGAGQLLGAPSPAQSRKDQNNLLQSAIKEEASSLGITRENDPVEYLSLTSKVLAENGETKAAANALKFAGTMDDLINSDQSSLERNIRARFGLSKRESINKHPKAGPFMQKIMELQNQPAREPALPQPSDRVANPNDFDASATYIDNALKDTDISFDDFDDTKNRELFIQAHSEEVRNRIATNKQQKKKPLNPNTVRKEVLEEMRAHIKEVGELQDVIPFRTNDVFFDFDSYLGRGGQVPSSTTSIDERR